MSSSMIKVARELYKSLTESDKRKTKSADVKAKVLRVEDNVVWVQIPNGYDETPVQKTNNANPGDDVIVRLSGGRAWLLGNNSSPATDDKTANFAVAQSNDAIEDAGKALDAAGIAQEAADSAIVDAARANEAAVDAQASADSASENAATAQTMANQAITQAGIANDQAISATNSANSAIDQLSIVEDIVGVLELLQKNGDYRLTTDTAPVEKKWYFTRSISDYNYFLTSDVAIDPDKTYYTRSGSEPDYTYTEVSNPDVADIATYYEREPIYSYAVVASPESQYLYFLTSDTDIVEGKIYYTRSGSGTEQDPYVYTQVVEPDVSDIGTYYEATNSPAAHGWYELIGVTQAIQNYVSSQLAVTDEGLWLRRPAYTGIQSKVLLSGSDGVVLYGPDGQIVGKYGATAQIGNENGFHIEMTGSEIGFYQATNKVAYISNNQLYITQTVVLQQMDLGEKVEDGGFGLWTWKVHQNGDTPKRNNLGLRWIG